MTHLSLTPQEIKVAPQLKLHTPTYKLNQFQKELNHRIKYEHNLEHTTPVSKEQFKQRFMKDTGQIPKQEPLERRQGKVKLSTTRELSRIMNYLQENRDIRITKLTEDCLLEGSIVHDALKFLIKTKLVEEKFEEGAYIYNIQKQYIILP